jgi:hypothetical protein
MYAEYNAGASPFSRSGYESYAGSTTYQTNPVSSMNAPQEARK